MLGWDTLISRWGLHEMDRQVEGLCPDRDQSVRHLVLSESNQASAIGSAMLRSNGLLAGLTVVLFSMTALADSMYRCPSGLVYVGDSTEEVKRKCGPPHARNEGYATIEQQLRTGATRWVRVRVVEWRYAPYGKFPRLLIFRDGRLVNITREQR